MREIHGDVRFQRQRGVLGHLGALVPGERPEQARGHVPDGLDDAVADGGGVPAVRQRDRDKVTALALHQCAHRGLPGPADHQVTLPVARHFAAFGLLGRWETETIPTIRAPLDRDRPRGWRRGPPHVLRLHYEWQARLWDKNYDGSRAAVSGRVNWPWWCSSGSSPARQLRLTRRAAG